MFYCYKDNLYKYTINYLVIKKVKNYISFIAFLLIISYLDTQYT